MHEILPPFGGQLPTPNAIRPGTNIKFAVKVPRVGKGSHLSTILLNSRTMVPYGIWYSVEIECHVERMLRPGIWLLQVSPIESEVEKNSGIVLYIERNASGSFDYAALSYDDYRHQR